ncbi:hypothetical protein C1T23_02921 [Lactiplantibacillus plantarum]|nr:IS30 family transposase [Lactiplantibacillus plantarum]AUS73588.1 hypothetical protein C1T23_02921 [Lactiplantibacillus plantarum]USZ13245.1 IS30 family transposase [Lactiplantibacillus plantarum]
MATLVDRKSRYLLAERVKTLTPDCGTEFANYQGGIDYLEIPVFFPDPHTPQQRGNNENTNVLIREYFSKGTDLNDLNDQKIIAHT